MSFLSKALGNLAPIVAAVPSPIQPFAAAFATADALADHKRLLKEQKQQQQRIANMEFDLPSGLNNFGGPNRNAQMQMSRPSSVNAGFGSGFGTFLSDVGRNIVNPISSIFSQVRPMITQQSRGQPALPTQSTTGGQESQQSGTNQAFMGGFGNVLGQAGRFLRTPAGQGLGIGGGLLASGLMGGDSQKVRITRKMKSQYRAVLNLNMGDYDMAADMIGVSTDFFIMVLLKRFRNDGPVVTKAALRKTKTTVRRLKNMCDMYDSLRPTATRRRTPMKRASTTLISNK